MKKGAKLPIADHREHVEVGLLIRNAGGDATNSKRVPAALDQRRRVGIYGIMSEVMANTANRVSPEAAGELIFLVEEAPEGGYTARAIGTSIFTEADTLAALHEEVRDAVRCHYEDGKAPRLVRLHFVRDEVLAV